MLLYERSFGLLQGGRDDRSDERFLVYFWWGNLISS